MIQDLISKATESNSFVEFIVKALIAASTWFITDLLGGWTPTMTTLLVLIALDYLSGIIRASGQGELSSSKGYLGIGKKMFILILVALAVELDILLGTGGTVKHAVVLFYCVNEIVSIIENAAGAGVLMPKILVNSLAMLNSKVEAITDDLPSLDPDGSMSAPLTGDGSGVALPTLEPSDTDTKKPLNE